MARWAKSSHPGLYRRNPIRRTASGSRLRAIMDVVSGRLTDAYAALDTAYDDRFVTTAAGDGLDQWGGEMMLDLPRNDGENDNDYRDRLLVKLRAMHSSLTVGAWEAAVFAAIGDYPLHIDLHRLHTGQCQDYAHLCDPFGWRSGGDDWNRQSATILLPSGLTEAELDDIEGELRTVKRQSERLLLAELDDAKSLNAALSDNGATASAVGYHASYPPKGAIDGVYGSGTIGDSWVHTIPPGAGTWWRVELDGYHLIHRFGLQQRPNAGYARLKDVRLVLGDGRELDWTLTDRGATPPPTPPIEYRWLRRPLVVREITVYLLSSYAAATITAIGEFEAWTRALTARRVVI